MNNPNQYELIHLVTFEKDIQIDKITRVVGTKLRDAILSIGGTLHSNIDNLSPQY